MDPLSDVLSLLKPRSYIFGGFEAGGDWSIQFAPHNGVKCYAIVSGACWLTVEGEPDPVRLTSGDCFLLPRGRTFCVASDLNLTPREAHAFLPAQRSGGIALVNGGGDFSIVGGFFSFVGDHAGMLLGMLPPIVHIREDADKATLRWSIERMKQEMSAPQPGGYLVAQHLAYLLLVLALRLHLSEGMKGGVGWLFALADKQMSAAINAMHGDPAHRWTLQELATRTGMSRSTFALKFKTTVGASPMDYLTRWRMMLAGDRLAGSSDSVSAIALSLGYESESAFSTAFKRVTGRSPRQYGRGRQRAFAPQDEQAGASRARLESLEG